MKNLLVTAFDPFGGSDRNASELAVALLPDRIGNFAVTHCSVPTVYGAATERALEAAGALKPQVVLCVGVAVGRDAVTPERVAINLRDARLPDNAGNQPADTAVVPGAPPAYFATVPVKKMVQAMVEAGLPAQVSYTAGTFVCNDLFFSLCHHFAGTETRVGFVHVPDTDVLQPEQVARALEIAIAACE